MLQNKPKDFTFFVLILTFLNFMGPVALLLPVPVFLYREKFEYKLSLSGIIFAGCFSFLISLYFYKDSAVLTYNTLQFFVLTLSFLYYFEYKTKRLFITLLLVVGVTFITIECYQLIAGIGFFQHSFDLLVKEVPEFASDDFLKSMKSTSKIVPAVMSISYGGIFLLYISIFAWIKKTKTNLTNFKLPEMLLPAFLVIALIYLGIIFYPEKSSEIELIFLNMLIVCSFFYFLSGFSIISFGMKLAKTPTFLKVFIYFTIIMQPGLILVTALGFADFWLDFRKKLLLRFKK